MGRCCLVAQVSLTVLLRFRIFKFLRFFFFVIEPHSAFFFLFSLRSLIQTKQWT
ncbi:unnamed protein product [Brassica napus]|uniref:(rape) hypothetical protein n=1 Tax=Brassica napus TaxID=3708 RepID=A0A817BFR8_BRANA|nr:unnamed protein product [Brassica napus]